MRELIKQPNGKFCRVSYYGTVEFSNLTEEDIVNMYIKWAKEDIENAKHYGEIIKRNLNSNIPQIDDKDLEEMGFDKSYKELVKFVSRKPLEEHYVDCDFTTYAKCPNCGGMVQNGMGHVDKKCKCGQLLEW